MFSILFSNRHEILLSGLLERLEHTPGGPFARHQVIVPNSALARYIELAMATRAGICVNIDFDYLAQWLWRQAAHVVDIAPVSSSAPAAMTWSIFALLDDDWVDAHPPLARYLAGADTRMRFDLATRLARLFDHYLGYRPDWLELWAQGKRISNQDDAGETWQAALWQRLRQQIQMDADTRLPLIRFLYRMMDTNGETIETLPARVHVFALPVLPPLHLAMLRALSKIMDVHLYVFNPCREYWCDIVDTRRLSWLAGRQQDLFAETRNKLLAAWGKQTQAQIELLFEGEHDTLEEARFDPHPGHHLLARLQNAILDLEELEPASVRLDAKDRSIELHLCHSRTRELEVLHDRLLALFKGPRPPRPEEIVVLTPDLAACAPLIEAVFGTVPSSRHIAWRITGNGSAENPVARVLVDLLALLDGRAPISQVFDLLRQPPVGAHFGFTDADLDRIRGWMEEAGIHWGLEAAQANTIGAQPGHTLEEGLSRLFLSWSAGEAAGAALFAGELGVAHAPQGSDGLVLGRFWTYAQTLGRLRAAAVNANRDAEHWRHLLLDALATLVGEHVEYAEDVRLTRAAINAFADDMAAGFKGLPSEAAMPTLDVIRATLPVYLDEGARGGVPGGAVTFSSLSSLRGLPYRVVCLIGLDREAFPTQARADEFDLMAQYPRKGDRQRRFDDRNLFLDLVLSARDVLHLSCVGRSQRDGGELPPSVVIDELFDVLTDACAACPEAKNEIRQRLTVVHPLQAFSPDYFLPANERDPRLRSFQQEYADALATRAAPRGKETRAAAVSEPVANALAPDASMPTGSAFFDHSLPFPPEQSWRHIRLERLKRFFVNPCRFLLRERMGLDLAESEEALEDVEPFVTHWSARARLSARLLAAGVGDMDEETLLALARAGGEYPTGNLGERALRQELAQLVNYRRTLDEARAASRPLYSVKLDFVLDGESWSVAEDFADLGADGWVWARYDDTRAVDYLNAWLDHLTLCAASPGETNCQTRGLSRNGHFILRPVSSADARAELERLLGLYRAGLCAPLRFFPKSAWEYVSHGESLSKARAKWSGESGYGYPESNTPAYRLALRGVSDALDERFCANARTIFGTLRQYLHDDRL
ncbi:MAG: exodeoxyribonuclease V subunit gamma [Azoarcus sp.]|jgi:exodeoxyribonuclease V gamma subunit|nr:exodeoxyribonuclease V subunit gamma [Azoarcus sp.]